MKEEYQATTGRPVSEGPSTLFDSGTPNGGYTNSQLGVNVTEVNGQWFNQGDVVNGVVQEGAKPVSIGLFSPSSNNPLFQGLNTLPGSPSFVDFHDALLEGFGFIPTVVSIPPSYAISQCVAMASICANFPDKFINVGTGGLINTNINNHIKPKSLLELEAPSRLVSLETQRLKL